MSQKPNALGTYLSARRALVTPQHAGIPETGVRRVPGLRREEVAMLAGISADYYLRLERGRDRNPSPQVLMAIGRVLCLNDEHMAHLLSLVADAPRTLRPRQRKEVVPDGALALLDGLVQPAFIEGRYFDILAANDLARALSPGLDVGGNQLRDFFLDSAQQTLYPEWEAMTECFVANLRQAVGPDIEDPRFIELTGELSLASVSFRRMWARHEVRAQYGTPIRFNHPEVGDLVLNRERLAISGADGQWLVIYHANTGSRDAEKLSILASACLPTRQPQRRSQPDEASRSENHR
ncbi:helix-turn-helix transcriptional regulator [Actinoplanes sp. NBRC 103695]|uniref:helix-turn-helix domain-containing protein n=1 Tax=Actinoplanes sp. NBRC 103695 TaxID=3032202 RepID=UPI0025571F14|nr:helix-turn-helix transcriptional regulator [Actinoplanes sp. NBRC 103695]